MTHSKSLRDLSPILPQRKEHKGRGKFFGGASEAHLRCEWESSHRCVAASECRFSNLVNERKEATVREQRLLLKAKTASETLPICCG